jgi:hypothetical protein
MTSMRKMNRSSFALLHQATHSPKHPPILWRARATRGITICNPKNRFAVVVFRIHQVGCQKAHLVLISVRCVKNKSIAYKSSLSLSLSLGLSLSLILILNAFCQRCSPSVTCVAVAAAAAQQNTDYLIEKIPLCLFCNKKSFVYFMLSHLCGKW